MLTLKSLQAGYGRLPVLKGIFLHVRAGEVVTLIGGNGAGKTTTLRTISGLLRAPEGGGGVRRPRPDPPGPRAHRRPWDWPWCRRAAGSLDP